MAKFLESELLYLVAYALKCPGKIKYTSNINIPNYCDFGISFRGNYIFLYPYTENYSLLEPILINRESLARDKISNISDYRARIILRKISKYLDILDEGDPVNAEALTNIIFSKHNSNLIELNPKLLGTSLTPIDFIEETQRLRKENIPNDFKIFARKIVSSLYNNDVLEYRDFYGNAIKFLLNKVDEENIALVDIVCLFLGKIDSDNTYIENIEGKDSYYLGVYSDIVTIDNGDEEIWRINIANEPPFKRAEFILNNWKETGMHLINSLATIINFDDKLEKIAQYTKMVSDVDKFSRF